MLLKMLLMLMMLPHWLAALSSHSTSVASVSAWAAMPGWLLTRSTSARTPAPTPGASARMRTVPLLVLLLVGVAVAAALLLVEHVVHA